MYEPCLASTLCKVYFKEEFEVLTSGRVELKFDDDLQKPGFWRIGWTEGGNITFFGFCFREGVN